MRCVLCERDIHPMLTWEGLFCRRKKWVACARCYAKFERARADSYEGINTLYIYNEAMKEWLHRFKFAKDSVVAHIFADELKRAFKRYKRAVVVPIPMHVDKKRERTFAHIDVLLEAAGVRYTHLLEKTTSDSQSQKSQQQRQKSATLFRRNAIQLKKDTPLVLVDDIVTTGTTIRHAREVLEQDGFINIEVVVLISARL
ncbi:amidophosphoribosyltransferase [Kurthia huakuii]|uniref:amidophosphoribosyltransferase n=1 Tax=Kurthia huakuii TaxID=1421019 RepID=UPI000496380C|nr:amidophosphoribosyltransferase [Kurthia huakuii]